VLGRAIPYLVFIRGQGKWDAERAANTVEFTQRLPTSFWLHLGSGDA